MTECIKCKKPLKAIGTSRTNGKQTHGDWASREYHKRCWKEEKKYSYMFDKCKSIDTFRDDLLDKILMG
tara:strand:+ start:230 stop:436 length:207 start_codon:yes stop_codon:yes gene_type:complete